MPLPSWMDEENKQIGSLWPAARLLQQSAGLQAASHSFFGGGGIHTAAPKRTTLPASLVEDAQRATTSLYRFRGESCMLELLTIHRGEDPYFPTQYDQIVSQHLHRLSSWLDAGEGPSNRLIILEAGCLLPPIAPHMPDFRVDSSVSPIPIVELYQTLLRVILLVILTQWTRLVILALTANMAVMLEAKTSWIGRNNWCWFRSSMDKLLASQWVKDVAEGKNLCATFLEFSPV